MNASENNSSDFKTVQHLYKACQAETHRSVQLPQLKGDSKEPQQAGTLAKRQRLDFKDRWRELYFCKALAQSEAMRRQ